MRKSACELTVNNHGRIVSLWTHCKTAAPPAFTVSVLCTLVNCAQLLMTKRTCALKKGHIFDFGQLGTPCGCCT